MRVEKRTEERRNEIGRMQERESREIKAKKVEKSEKVKSVKICKEKSRGRCGRKRVEAGERVRDEGKS